MLEKENPPSNVFIDILDNCPWAIHLYYLVWKNKEKNSVKIFLEDSEDMYYITPSHLREYLFDLAELDLLTFKLKQDSIVIELFEPSIDAEGKILC